MTRYRGFQVVGSKVQHFTHGLFRGGVRGGGGGRGKRQREREREGERERGRRGGEGEREGERERERGRGKRERERDDTQAHKKKHQSACLHVCCMHACARVGFLLEHIYPHACFACAEVCDCFGSLIIDAFKFRSCQHLHHSDPQQCQQFFMWIPLIALNPKP